MDNLGSMMDVLEHMPFPRSALLKAARLLRTGGIIVISLPDLGSSSWKIMDAAQANPYWMEIEHHHNFSRQRLVALLGEFGFEVADFSVPHRYKAQMEIYAVRARDAGQNMPHRDGDPSDDRTTSPSQETLGRPKFSCPPTGGLLSPNTASGQALRCQTMPSRACFW
jgi:SAM-dependent methyltransferase